MAPIATLADLLETLDAAAVTPWAMPAEAASARPTDVVIFDRHDAEDLVPGAVVLAVGLDVTETASLLVDCARRDVAAVVTRGERSARSQLTDVALEHGIPLLATAPGVGWAQAGSLLRNALSTSGAHAGQDGARVPHHDLTEVANTLASALNGSVVIFNPQQQVLAASRLRPDDDPMRHQAVTDQHGPAAYRERLRELGVYRRLWSGDHVVAVPEVPELGASRRLAVAIRAGDEILGSIWVAEGGRPLSKDSAQILRNAATAASGHLVWLQARAQSQRRHGEGLLLQLLSGEVDVNTAAGWLGIQADQPCAVIAAWTPDPRNRRRLSNLLTLHFAAYRHSTMALVSRSAVDLVLCDLEKGELSIGTVRDLVSRTARSLGEGVLAGVGSVQETLQGLPRSHQDADAVLRVLRRETPEGITRVADQDEVRPQVQIDLLRHYLSQRPDLLDGHAKTLYEWDSTHGGELSASMLAYLEAFGNVTEGARRIHVHPNTLRYRVRKACAVADIDLNDPDQRLIAQLQLSTFRLSVPTDGRTHFVPAHDATTTRRG